MTGPKLTNRRTVLKTTGATVLGGGVLTGTANAVRAAPPGEARGRRSTLEIVATHDHVSGEHLFELDTGEVPAGWTTIEFENPTEHAHFVYLGKLPQQAIEDAAEKEMDLLDFYVETVTRPFQFFMDTLVPGKEPDPADLSDVYPDLFPPWFGDVLPSGGPGLTAGHAVSTTTVDLDPGKYIAECYVKNDDNDFHSYLGMIDLLTVTGAPSGVPEPEATLDLSLSTAGIDVDSTVRPGRHVVAVEFEEQTVYSNLIGHDVHLIRLDDETDLQAVNEWMNWADPNQLISDGTEPGRFLGGVQDISTGDLPETAYYHVTLKPGDYAWVAEIPDPASKNMLQAFTVPFGRDTGKS